MKFQKIQLFQSLAAQLWDSREPRERRLISVAAAVVILGAVYAFVLDPAVTGTAQLKASLPAAQAQLAQVKVLSEQVQAMPKDDAAAGAADITQASLQASLSAATIDGTVSLAAPWRITVRGSSGDALWNWLRQHSASSADLKRSSNDASATWQGEVTLQP
jgi:general secretion pathway protein M